MKIAFNTNYADNPALMSYPNDEIHRNALVQIIRELGEEMDRHDEVPLVAAEAATQTSEVAAA